MHQELTLALGLTNLLNRMPPLSPQSFTDNDADVPTYSPLGRLVDVPVQVAF